MDARTLMAAMQPTNMPLSHFERLLPAYLKAMERANINTVERAAMFAAQIGHESIGLQYTEELWGPTPEQKKYEGMASLGNVRPGDGFRYKGRDVIQITGRANYRNLSKWAHSQGIVPTPTFFEADPEALASDEYMFTGTVWYWTVARNINARADKKDLFGASADINGWIKLRDGTWRTPNGYADRKARYERALRLGNRLLPGGRSNMSELRLDYSRTQVAQDTYYNCGPASVQTIIQAATGKFRTEQELGGQLGTHTGGTDYIGQFPAVLNRHIPGAQYRHKDVPNYLNAAGKDDFWDDIVGSINAGHGVVVNIVAPPSNYPKAVAPSKKHPQYKGGTVYHYFAVMGYSTDGQRKVWVADSGFYPYGYWLSFEQLCSLVVPKGYAYSTAKSQISTEGTNMAILTGESAAALNDAKVAAQAAEANTKEILDLVHEMAGALQKTKSEIMILNEQFAGPARDEHKNLQWTGWPKTDEWPGTDGVATIQHIVTKIHEIEDAVKKGKKND